MTLIDLQKKQVIYMQVNVVRENAPGKQHHFSRNVISQNFLDTAHLQILSSLVIGFHEVQRQISHNVDIPNSITSQSSGSNCCESLLNACLKVN